MRLWALMALIAIGCGGGMAGGETDAGAGGAAGGTGGAQATGGATGTGGAVDAGPAADTGAPCSVTGCDLGSSCEPDGACKFRGVFEGPVPFSVQCGGSTVQARVFDRADGQEWPRAADPPFLFPINPLDPAPVSVDCTMGSTICYGATSSVSTGGRPEINFGVGLDGAGTCTDCCFPCGQVPPPTIKISCLK